MSDYVLSSPEEKDRLQLQARLWEPEAERLLDQIGVQPGWKCLDVGCGAMGILRSLSRRVGPTGRVVGIDKDPALLAAARAFVAEEELANVEILEADARETGFSKESFDLVHVRFMLVFGQAQKVLDEMYALSKPGGVVIAQETDQSGWNFYPPNPTWPRLKEALESAFLRIGGNANIGQEILPMLKAMGLMDTKLRAATLAVPGGHPYMRMPLIGAMGFRETILQAGLMTEVEFSEVMEAMEKMIANPETYAIWFNVVQAWGRKTA